MTHLRPHDANVIRLAARRMPAPVNKRALRWFIASIRQWLERTAARARERRELAKLSERDLKDLGLTPYDVEFKLRTPLWR